MADWRAPRFGGQQAPAWMTDDYSQMAPVNLDPGFNPATALYPVSTTGQAPGTTPPPPTKSAEDIYWEQRAAQDAAARTAQQDATAAAVQAAFESYGLGGMYNTILDYARRGYGADTILLHLRQTPEYKARFPAMETLNKKGRAISEAAYIDYERTAASLEQRYGLPEGMLLGNVTTMLENDLSAAEMNDRVQIAVADSLQAPEDLKQTLRDYYQIDPETALKAYYLDPDIAVPLLEKQSAAARIGTWASRQGVGGVGVGLAEELQGLGVTEARAQEGFGAVAQQAGLGAGRGDVASQSTRIAANLKGTAGAAAAVERAARSRVGRFSGGGSFAESKTGIGGLGTA